MADYYDILGVSKGSSDKEVRQAFRRLARKFHPDLNPGDEAGEKKFKEINEAYEVLSDAEDRKKYDKYGDKWTFADQIESQTRARSRDPFTWRSRTSRGGPSSDRFGGFDDLLGGFGDLSGNRRRSSRTSPIEGDVKVTLEEAFAGTNREVTITSGGEERKIEVTIPAGVKTGSVVRVNPGKGQQLRLKITVAPHRSFTRVGDDLITEVGVPLEDAVLGGEVEVRTLNSNLRVKVPPESQNGQRIRLSRQGMPKLGADGERGDLLVTVRPRMPSGLSEEQKELFHKLKELSAG